MKTNLKMEKVEEFRKAQGLTKSEFCKLCNVSLNTYNRLLHKENDFYLKTLFKILRVTNMKFVDVL